jgi:signal transduction histidine kinase
MTRRFSALVVALSTMMLVAAWPASGQSAKAILVINSYGNEAPGRGPFDNALLETFRELQGSTANIYVETLDVIRVPGQTENLRRYLRAKYAAVPIALIVAARDPALDFVTDPADPLFPGIPVAAVLSGRPRPQQADYVTAIWPADPYGGSAAVALALHPGTRTIAVIDGVIDGDIKNSAHDETLRQIGALGITVPVSCIHEQELDAVETRVRALPPNSVVLITRMSIRRSGRPISNDEALREIARTSPVPVYTVSDQLIGAGAVGGNVISLDRSGETMARLALRMLSGDKTARGGEFPLMPLFDWRELRRWGIDEQALPAGSVILFKPLTAWEQYRNYIIGAVLLVGVQSVLIAGLIAQRIRRRTAETALRQSYDRNRDLAGRLINAQEAERRRIARDLHDDVSQQLAGLSIMMSGLRQRIGRLAPSADINESMVTMQERTTTLAKSVRNLSHELHPDVLKHAGLVATLRQHFAEAEKLYAMKIEFAAAENLGGLSQEAALCLFRVAQEALTNALRHAQATTITVSLSATLDQVALQVTDDGVGFAAAKTAGGLGLRSIDERVRLAGGQVTVASKPGAGTTLLVRVPRNPAC